MKPKRIKPRTVDFESAYLERMKDVARENWIDWGYLSPKEAWEDQINNPTYDYRGYYSDPDLLMDQNGNSLRHWPDKYKTPLHKTFSNESIYSGTVSDKNPYGLRGGMWIGDKFIPAAWLSKSIGIPKYRYGKDDEAEPALLLQVRLLKPNTIPVDTLVANFNRGLSPAQRNDLGKPMSGVDPVGEFAVSYYVPYKGMTALSKFLAKRNLTGLANTYRLLRNNGQRDIGQYGENMRPQNIKFADKEARRIGPYYPESADNPLMFLYDTFVDPVIRKYAEIQKNPVLNAILP